MSFKALIPALAVLATAGSSVAGTNFLNNASFENPLGFDFSNPSNWNGFFGGPAGTFLQAFNDTGAAARSGDRALVTTIRGIPGVTDGFNAFTGHVQIVTGLTAGSSYELSVWARGNPTVLDGAEYRIEWQNASGVEIGRVNTEIHPFLTGDYQRFAITAVAPEGATRAAVVFAVQSFFHTGNIADTSVAWDDASLTVIPAPASLGLLAMAGLTGLRRRRRR
jgi:hypothetical protein